MMTSKQALEKLKTVYLLYHHIGSEMLLRENERNMFAELEKELKRLEIQDQILCDLKANHIEFVVEDNGGCYFKIKNTKGKERSYTSYSFIDFWRQVF